MSASTATFFSWSRRHPRMFPLLRAFLWNEFTLCVVVLVAAMCGGVAGVVGMVAFRHRDALELVAGPSPLVVDAASRELTTPITVSSTLATEVKLAGIASVGWYCDNETTTNVFVVDEGATTTAHARGPYCSTCTLGPLFGHDHERRAWLLAASGTPAVDCKLLVP